MPTINGHGTWGTGIRWHVPPGASASWRRECTKSCPFEAIGIAGLGGFSSLRRGGESPAAARLPPGPALPLPTGRPSILTTGITIWLAEVMKASRAACASSTRERALLQLEPLAPPARQARGAGDAGRMPWSACRVTTSPSRGDDPGVGRRAFGDEAVAVDEPGLAGALLARRLLGEHVGQQRHRLDVDALPAVVGHGDDRDAFGGQRARRRRGRACAR